ncbi:MAG: carbon storage regulator, partial [Planctomycetota bacterium]
MDLRRVLQRCLAASNLKSRGNVLLSHPKTRSARMLVLSRKPGERILISGDIEVTVVSVRGDSVRIGVVAP